jgi:hypothetical protein
MFRVSPTKIRKSLKAGHISFIYDLNYFDLFKLPVRYDINKMDLVQYYNFNKEQAYIKDAFKILNDDVKRASYILKLKGIKVEHIKDDFIKDFKYNPYMLPALKEEVNEALENVKNDFAMCIDYDENLSANKHYILIYKLTKLNDEIFKKIND